MSNEYVVNVTPSEMSSGFHNGDNDFKKVVAIVDETLAGVISAEQVAVCAPHSKPVELKNKPGVFQLVLWSTVGGEITKLHNITNSIYGYHGVYKNGIYAPNGAGVAISSPEGDIIAEYFPEYNTLMTLFDACHFSSDYRETEQVLGALLEEFVNVYYERPDGIKYTKEQLEERRAKARAEAQQKAIVSMLDKMTESKIKGIKDNIRRNDETLVQYKAEVIRMSKEKTHLESQLTSLSANSEETRAKIMDEFNKILDIKGIVKFEIDSDKLAFYTDTIYMPVNGARYLAGKYKILVNPNNSEVRFQNLTPENMRRSYWGEKCMHPHISDSGNACLGNASEILMQLIIQNEWSGLAMMLIAYLESVNLNDGAGRFYVNWDRVDADGKIVAKGINTNNPRETVTCHKCGKDIDIRNESYGTCNDCGHVFCTEHYDYLESRGFNVCGECHENYVKCAHCGKEIKKSHAISKDGKYYCKEHVPETAPAGTHKCPICGKFVKATELYTCEVCGTQGCSTCIQPGALPNGNTGYACAEHRG